VEDYYQPYRQQAEHLVTQAIARHGRVVHLSCHSFTPELDGKARTADIGLLYDPARPGEVALAACWKAAIEARAPELTVRRNYPYAGKNDGLTTSLRKRLSPELLCWYRTGAQSETRAAWGTAVDRPARDGHRVPAVRRSIHCGADSLEETTRSRPNPSHGSPPPCLQAERACSGISPMKIRIGYELVYECPKPTPMIVTLNVHYTRISDLIVPDHMIADPPVPVTAYRDSFGNWCSRIVAPAGLLRLSANAIVNDSGQPDPVVPRARQTPVQELPDTAWQLFENAPEGWARVQAISDFVHRHIVFGYQHARSTKTAFEVY
jgi:hypothetical protein